MDLKKTHNVYTTIFSLNFQIVFFFFYSCWFLAIFVVPRPLACATFVRLKTKIFHCSLFTTSSSTSTSLTFPTTTTQTQAHDEKSIIFGCFAFVRCFVLCSDRTKTITTTRANDSCSKQQQQCCQLDITALYADISI